MHAVKDLNMASLGPRTGDGDRHFLTRRTETVLDEMLDAGVIDGTAMLMVQSAISTCAAAW